MLKAGKLFTFLRRRNNRVFFQPLNKQLLAFKQAFSFSQELSKKGWDLTDEEQMAIVSYYVFDQIIKTQQKDFLNDIRSIGERIFKREYLTKCILEKANLYAQTKRPQSKDTLEDSNYHRGFTDLYQVGFSEANIDKVLKAFDSQRGIRYNSQIWTQNRFKMALSPNGLLVLMPNLRTGRIFKVINETIVDQYTTFGEKGTGKSFAFFIYDYLSTFIIEYRLSLINSSKTPSELFTHFIPSDQLIKFKKLFYIAIKEVKDESQLLFRLKNQFSYKSTQYIEKGEQQISSNKISKFLSSINQYYNYKKIQTVCVVDQTNAYYSSIRQLIAQYQQTGTDARIYSNSLQLLYKKFNLIVYNSAYELQSKLIRFFNSSNTASPYFDPYDHDRWDFSNQNIRYSKLLSQKQGHIYLYSLFWDELCKQYQNIRLSQNESVHNYFKQAFGLQKGSQAFKQVSFVWWKYDVRHVAISSFINQRKINHHQDQTIIQQNDKDTVINLFKDMKEMIEKKRFDQLQTTFRNFSDRALKRQMKIFRYQILKQIFTTAATQQRIENMNFCIEVDFLGTIKQFKKKYRSYSSDIDKQMKRLTQQLGLGDRISNEDNNTQFAFIIDNKMLTQISKLIYQDLKKINRLIQFYTLDKSLSVRAAGELIDLFRFQFFRAGIEWLKFEERDRNNNFVVEKYLITKALPFIASTQTFTTSLKNSLKEIINFAQLQKYSVVLGYPVLMYESKEQNKEENLMNYHFFPNNPIFDFLTVFSISDTLLIRTFDTTVGEIQNKIQNTNLQAIEWQIQEISKQYNIKVEWQHTIMGQQRCIDNWINSGNKTGLKQAWFLQQRVEPTLRWQNGESKVVGSLQLSLSKFKVNQIDDHCVLDRYRQNSLQNQLWSPMKQVMNEFDRLNLFQEAYHKNRNSNNSAKNEGIKQQARAQMIIWQMVREAQQSLASQQIIKNIPFILEYFNKKNLSEILKISFDKLNLKVNKSNVTKENEAAQKQNTTVNKIEELLLFFDSITSKRIPKLEAQKIEKSQLELQWDIKTYHYFQEQMKEKLASIIQAIEKRSNQEGSEASK